jgi:hypothetical protein
MEEDSEMGFNPAQASGHDHAGDIIAVLQPKKWLIPRGSPGVQRKAKRQGQRQKEQEQEEMQGQRQMESARARGSDTCPRHEQRQRQRKPWAKVEGMETCPKSLLQREACGCSKPKWKSLAKGLAKPLASIDMEQTKPVGFARGSSWWQRKKQRLVKWKAEGKIRMRAEQHQPEQILAELMKGCSIEDLYFLLNFDQLQDCVYKLDLLAKKVIVGASELPWPVKFVLSRFNRKHVFANGTLLDEQAVCRDVAQFVLQQSGDGIFKDVRNLVIDGNSMFPHHPTGERRMQRCALSWQSWRVTCCKQHVVH